MPVETFEYRTETERVAMVRALAFVAQMHDLALSAPAGQVRPQLKHEVFPWH